MKKIFLALALVCSFCLLVTGCGKTPTGGNVENAASTETGEEALFAGGVEASDVLADFADASRTPTGDFAIQAPLAGKVTQTKTGYEITGGGTYTLTGALQGTLTVRAGEEESVTLVLNGTAITSDSDSAICIESAKNALVTVQEGTYNLLSDQRTAGEDHDGALFAVCDLSLGGNGTLIVESSFENGIKTKDDLTVSTLSLKVTSPSNALKGNDSVTINSGNLILISTTSDGIKTENSDVSSNGKQRGDIAILGGHTDLYTADDGVSAVHDVTIDSDSTILNVFTASRAKEKASSVTFSIAGDASAKGVKAENSVSISGGVIGINAQDDGVHASADTTDDAGNTGTGAVTVRGGTLVIDSGDDGIHADGELVISQGTVRVAKSHEGLEANTVTLAGGKVSVTADDDGINAVQGTASPQVIVSGGAIDVTTPSGDTDAIDSNGTFVMSGGVLLVRGGAKNGGMAGSIDTERGVTVTGGTLLAFGGISSLPASGSVNTFVSAGTAFSAGEYRLTDQNGTAILAFSLDNAYQSFWIASDRLVLNESYRLTSGNTDILSWTQSDTTVGADGAMNGGGMGAMGKGGMFPGGNGQMPDGGNGQMPDGGNGQMPDGNRQMPDGGNGQMPGGGPNHSMKKGGIPSAPSDSGTAT